jgi:hypothetical protein
MASFFPEKRIIVSDDALRCSNFLTGLHILFDLFVRVIFFYLQQMFVYTTW